MLSSFTVEGLLSYGSALTEPFEIQPKTMNTELYIVLWWGRGPVGPCPCKYGAGSGRREK